MLRDRRWEEGAGTHRWEDGPEGPPLGGREEDAGESAVEQTDPAAEETAEETVLRDPRREDGAEDRP
ncbi:hypothetical protein Shyhy02_67320 [Streptomyces hygroscopicus subsp. hygroscopicus]|nr:hypothetical protein Shyhy02_67320 [Streptomyces hygroscopicus subsp. hygroscopicus]